MTGRPAPPSASTAMVQAVAREIMQTNGSMAQVACAAIAAVFDNLPREAMAKAAWEASSVASPGARHWPNWDELYEHGTKADRLAEMDAAISAAREAVLGGAKGDA